ncbi:MAG: apolipoprotein N-acyltransferase [Planctomycetes bacterium]|nr:apolipoprotein N-acyltransferase [Planctomycetota bacterium]
MTTPQEIITSARNAPAKTAGALVLSGLTAVLMWASFPPVDFGPLAWVCLIPLLMLVRIERPVKWMYAAVYGGGLLFWMSSLQWMRLGDPAMYFAWLALAVYLAAYFPVFLGLTRVAVWRLNLPLTLAAPVIWTGLELLRGHLLTGFSWYYLGHTQHQWTSLIQISDLVGAYGVSFLIALHAGCAAEMLPGWAFARFGLLPPAVTSSTLRVFKEPGQIARVAGCLTLLVATLVYGQIRRSGIEFKAGPRVALIQGNFTSAVKHDPEEWPKIQKRHEWLTGQAVKEQPDLIVWPETMFRWPWVDMPRDVPAEELQTLHPDKPVAQFQQAQSSVQKKLSNMAQMAGAGMVIGLERINIDRDSFRIYNSAVLVRPDGILAGQYDKLHRVMFGEYIPLVDSMPWLRKLTPFGEGFGISAGQACAAFEYEGYRFAPIICFEDTVPHLVRGIVNSTTVPAAQGTGRVDFLVNMTNDGWFHGSSELDQHLITARFRCVECRTPMVRAVNTGISAFIDGDGVVRKQAEGLKTHGPKLDDAIVVDHVPLDSRQSLYLRAGDWFAGLCLACCGFVSLTGIFGRFFSAGSQRPERT